MAGAGRHGRTLAARLTAWYALTTFALVAGAAAVQYRILERDLARGDDQLVLETAAAQQRTLSRSITESGGTTAPSPDANGPAADVSGGASQNAAALSLGRFVRELDARCRMVRGHWPPNGPPPDCRTPARATPTADALRVWRSPDGHTWRVVAVAATLPTHRVEVALDRWPDQSVLADYRRTLGVVLVMTLGLAGALGYVLARRGLTPLSALAQRMAQLDARALDAPPEPPSAASTLPPDLPPEMQTLLASFEAMRERLRSAFAALSRFSAELAHEFRTPLHILRQQFEVALTQPRAPEAYRELLGSSLEKITRLERLVDDTLFLARAEDPRATIDRRRLAARAELCDVAEYIEAFALEHAVTLDVQAPPDLPLVADRALARRALVNVVTNAIRHTPPGGRVVLAASAGPGATVLTVTDTGEGVPPALLPRVFDRYVRGVRKPGRDGESTDGTGLGLAIVRGVVQLHGGTARMDSVTGQGSCVTLVFPTSHAATGRS